MVFIITGILFLFSAGILYADAEDDLGILETAYPGAFETVSGKGIRFSDGTWVPYNDGEIKSFEALLDHPDIEDMLSLPYPPGEQNRPPAFNYDPGRFRPDAFFKGLYGKNEKEIRSSLRAVQWMPSLNGPWLLISTKFGIDKKLEKIISELETLGPEYHKYLIPPGGTFNYRVVAGTNRLSMHSFGIALDIAVGPSHYWQWEQKGPGEYKNSIPYRIVEIFEKHGFIWGGKWYHFDTMHFEYRPELILKARKQPKQD